MAWEDESDFAWGNVLSQDEIVGGSKRRRSEKAIIKYSSCYVNKELISIGDDVIIDIEGEKEEAVGRIQDLYNDNSQDEPCRAVIHWYFKKHELPSRVQDKIGSFLSEQYELFWRVDNEKKLRICIDDIDAETIRTKCLVIILPSSTRHRKNTGKYFIRFGFTTDNKLISDRELLIQFNHAVGKRTPSKETPKKSAIKTSQ
ncbi:origin recognition complex, subunit 1-like, partial [Paramuricea clavata]